MLEFLSKQFCAVKKNYIKQVNLPKEEMGRSKPRKSRKPRKPRKSRKKQLNKEVVLPTTENKEIYTQKPIGYSLKKKKKKQIFHDFRVFVFSPTLKNENSEVREIFQKQHNTVIWGCSFKTLEICSNDIKLKIIQPHWGSCSRYLSFKSFWPLLIYWVCFC